MIAPDDTYKTITSKSEGYFRDRGSKFIAEAFPVSTEQEIKKVLIDTKKKHPKANHHCYAWRLTPDKTVFKCSDDREPTGSAGRPILNAILSNDLTGILIIVSRYFGGTLLGVPGLINAYRSAAQDAIDHVAQIVKTVNEIYELRFDYSLMNEVMRILKNENVHLIHQNFNDICIFKFELRKSKSEILLRRIKDNYRLVKNCKIIHLS
ncbi:MAG: YigZ family protein [Bacteroidota bacterium]